MCRLDAAPVQAWAPAVNSLIGSYNIPGARAAERVLRWISIESCGNQCSIDASRTAQISQGWVPDAGVMQIYFSSPNQVINGATSASLRANCIGVTQIWPTLTDVQRQALLAPQLGWLQGAIASAQSELDAIGAVWSERDQWRWYKFRTHGLPAFAKCMLWVANNQLGRAPSGWDEMRSVAGALPSDTIAAGAADPSDNGCTWTAQNVSNTKLLDMAWTNAEEMDLPDEQSFLTNINDIVVDLFTGNAPSNDQDAGLSGLEIALIGLAGIAGLYGAYKLSKRLGYTHPV